MYTGFRLGQPRNDDVAEGGLNLLAAAGSAMVGVERERGCVCVCVCVCPTWQLCQLTPLTLNIRSGFTTFKPTPCDTGFDVKTRGVTP